MREVRSRRRTGSIWVTLSGSPWATIDTGREVRAFVRVWGAAAAPATARPAGDRSAAGQPRKPRDRASTKAATVTASVARTSS
jgi:hypothetical protein